ncbi:cytochrome c-type biogenesis protein CcmE [Sphingomonas guangdongensis]|uniref:Cytochrome c-type biogenesis protein CcmE n=1 Tax=Sphingomonas guangdongensis TaxID=1141890 RepID=A0A285QYA9_9SPHN|nr:cytochrome c maturation protein CcmE [Sphingomonas guangdongensis]SOB86950.1 cytochrome c-type biogenesis protein CcmE [Sphingomonas guangdongensis]
MTAKHQRLTLALLALLAITGAALLALSGLRDQAAFFYAPADLRRAPPAAGTAIRLGGMVARGSVSKAADGVTTRFVVGDGQATTPVTYRGILPDLFREGSGVVAEGRLDTAGTFVADTILAKHDERYMPPEVAGALHKTETLER